MKTESELYQIANDVIRANRLSLVIVIEKDGAWGMGVKESGNHMQNIGALEIAKIELVEVLRKNYERK